MFQGEVIHLELKAIEIITHEKKWYSLEIPLKSWYYHTQKMLLQASY